LLRACFHFPLERSIKKWWRSGSRRVAKRDFCLLYFPPCWQSTSPLFRHSTLSSFFPLHFRFFTTLVPTIRPPMLAADNASTSQKDLTTVDSPGTAGPLQTLNVSLKRIRLNEETHQPMTRTDSIEKEWVSTLASQTRYSQNLQRKANNSVSDQPFAFAFFTSSGTARLDRVGRD